MSRDSDGSFAGKVAVVTGGSTGIGRATVDTLAARGARVVYCSHDAATLDSAATELAHYGDAVTGVQADVRDAADMRGLVDQAVRRHGGLDVLVCSAGVQTYGTVEDTSEADWRTVLDTNLTGMFLAAKFAVPHLRVRGRSAIVNVSSIQGMTPAQRVVGYSVSKAAIDALSRAMAVDHAVDGIRVNSVAPGPVATSLVVAAGDPEASTTVNPVTDARGVVFGRIAEPAEVANVIAFLAGDEASYVTGTTVLVDGGMHASAGQVLLPGIVAR